MTKQQKVQNLIDAAVRALPYVGYEMYPVDSERHDAVVKALEDLGVSPWERLEELSAKDK